MKNMKTQKLNRSEQIIDQIPYFFFLDEEESIVYNKNDTIQKTIKVIYRNLDFTDVDTRLLIFDKLNNAIMSLNTENYFSIYFETQRRKVQIREEIEGNVSIPVKKIFTERREQVNTEEDNFVTENYITVNYNVSRMHQLKSIWNMIIGKKRKTIEEVINQDFSKFIEEFDKEIDYYKQHCSDENSTFKDTESFVKWANEEKRGEYVRQFLEAHKNNPAKVIYIGANISSQDKEKLISNKLIQKRRSKNAAERR